MNEYDCIKPAYIVCRTKRTLLLTTNILALPWQKIGTIIKKTTI